jgi:hypothetical protein
VEGFDLQLVIENLVLELSELASKLLLLLYMPDVTLLEFLVLVFVQSLSKLVKFIVLAKFSHLLLNLIQ